MKKSSPSHEPVPAVQPDVELTAAITQNQWYDAFTGLAVDSGGSPPVKNCVLVGLYMRQQTANEDLEVQIIVDGNTLEGSQAATFGTDYYVRRGWGAEVLEFTTTNTLSVVPYILKGRSVQVEYRKTSATGANETWVTLKHSKY